MEGRPLEKEVQGEVSPETTEKKEASERSLEEELKVWKDRALRYAAELENLKKAFQREKEEYYKFALENVFKELLPSIDNLELALKTFENTQNLASLKEGVALSLKVILQTLEKLGLQQFEPAVGDSFEPWLHEALQTESHPEIAPGKITKVYQKGYKLHHRLLRPALVCVCVSKSQATSPEESIEGSENNGTE